MFKPSFNHFDFDGIEQGLFDSICRCDCDIRRDLYANIVLAGGNTMFDGFAERIEKELIRLAPATMDIKVVAPPNRKDAAWFGGSILGSDEIFKRMVITRAEYNDGGVGVVHHYCH
jgi:actin beta/gamma 1